MLGHPVRQSSCHCAAQRPADQAGRAAVPTLDFHQAFFQPPDNVAARTDVDARIPWISGIASVLEETAKRPGTAVVGNQTRQNHYRVAVAARRALEHRPAHQQRAPLEYRSPLQRHQQR